MKKLFSIVAAVVLLSSSVIVSAQDFLSTDASAFRLQSRFTGGIELSIAPSKTVAASSLTPSTFSIKAGYKLKNTNIFGLFGVEYLNEENFIPLAIELKQYFSSNTWAPFAYAQTGYSLHLKRNIQSRYFTADYAQYDPSFFLKIGVGYSYVTSLNEFYFSLGYLYHQLEEIVVEQAGEVRTDLTMSGVALTVGFTF